MKWILYLMLFTTPAANVTKAEQTCFSYDDVSKLESIFDCRQKYEGKHVWALQSSSQLEFSTLESCVKHQDQLMANSNVASTMTLRSWCFCDSDKQECPTDADVRDKTEIIRSCEINPQGALCKKAEVKSLVGRTEPEKGQNSSSIRLYPPMPKQNK